jgi:hypothetical protein
MRWSLPLNQSGGKIGAFADLLPVNPVHYENRGPTMSFVLDC